MHPPRAIPSRRNRRRVHTINRPISRPVNRLRNENQNGGSRSPSTPNILEALLPMFRMQRQLLEMSRDYCQRMREKIDRVEQSRKRCLEKSMKRPKWTHRIHLTGVRPDDIQVTIKEDQLVVSSRGNTFDTRILTIPPDVVADDVTSYLTQEDNLVFEAPFKPREYNENSSQTENASQTNASLEESSETLEQASRHIKDGASQINGNGDSMNDNTIWKYGKEDNEKIICIVTDPSRIEPIVKCTNDGVHDEAISSQNDKQCKQNACDKSNTTDAPPKTEMESNSTEDGSVTSSHLENNERDQSTDIPDTTNTQPSTSKDSSNANTFKFDVDLGNFSKSNVHISVKGHTLIIKAEMEVTDGDMEYTESLNRSYQLPNNIDVQRLECIRKNDGSFRVSAPYVDEERSIPIQSEN